MGKHSLSSSSGHQLDKQGFGAYQIFNYLYLYKKPFRYRPVRSKPDFDGRSGVIVLSGSSLLSFIAWLQQDIALWQGNFVPLPGTKRYVGRKNSSEQPSVIWNMVCCQSRFAGKNPTLDFSLHSSPNRLKPR